MTKHEEYFYQTIYAVILEYKDGGQTMETYVDEDKARAEAARLIKIADENNIDGYSIILSPLEYSQRKNRIMSENIINEESEILYGKGRS